MPSPAGRRPGRGVRWAGFVAAANGRGPARWLRGPGCAAGVPVAVIGRLGPSLYASARAAGQALARARLSEAEAKSLADRKPPVWIYVHGLKSPLSSTALRAARHKTDSQEPQYEDCGTAAG